MTSTPGHPIRRRRPSTSQGEDADLRDSARGERLQKVLAAAGVGSRRTCEELIADGAVKVNGKVIDELPAWVDPYSDRITVHGRGISLPERPVYVMLFKPERVLSTTSDPGGRKTVAELVKHPSGTRLYPVGRVEFDAQGLVVLTNDGELTRRLTHASFGVTRTLEVLVRGDVTEESVARLARAISAAKPGVRLVDGKAEAPRKAARDPAGRKRAGRVDVEIVDRSDGKSLLRITLLEGRNREVGRVLKESGFPVRKTVHVALGALTLSGLRPGEWRELTREEVRLLRDSTDPARRPAPTPRATGVRRSGRRTKPERPARSKPGRHRPRREE